MTLQVVDAKTGEEVKADDEPERWVDEYEATISGDAYHWVEEYADDRVWVLNVAELHVYSLGGGSLVSVK